MNEFKHSVCDLISTMASTEGIYSFSSSFQVLSSALIFLTYKERERREISLWCPPHKSMDTELGKEGEKKSYRDTLKHREVFERQVSRSLGLAELRDEGKH